MSHLVSQKFYPGNIIFIYLYVLYICRYEYMHLNGFWTMDNQYHLKNCSLLHTQLLPSNEINIDAIRGIGLNNDNISVNIWWLALPSIPEILYQVSHCFSQNFIPIGSYWVYPSVSIVKWHIDDLNPCSACFSYESSGYDHTPSQIRKVYTSQFGGGGGTKPTSVFGSSVASRVMHQSTTSGYSYSDRSGDESAIESGPSFNESLQRFKRSTAAAHSDTEAAAAAMGPVSSSASPPPPPMQHSSFKMTSSRQQTQNKTVTRSVEEQTMITRNSQKSYHIEWMRSPFLSVRKPVSRVHERVSEFYGPDSIPIVDHFL